MTVIAVNTIADMIALDVTSLPAFQQVIVGTSTPSIEPQAGSLFVLDTASPYPADGGVHFQTNVTSAKWVRQFSGPIDIRWFGAVPDGSTDMAAAWLQADTYAHDKRTTLYIPSAPQQGAWILKTPITLIAPRTTGDVGIGDGTEIVWDPGIPYPDLTAAITLSASNFVFEHLAIRGMQSFPHPANLVTGETSAGSTVFIPPAIPAIATAICSFSEFTMTVTTPGLDTFKIGNAISGAGMKGCGFMETIITGGPSVGGGAGSVYTISICQDDLTNIQVTQTGLPYLTGLVSGYVAIRALGVGLLNDVKTSNTKIGRELAAGGGHVISQDCAFGGLIGTFTSLNGQDYKDIRLTATGCNLAAHLVGNQGWNGFIYASHFGFSPFGFLQLIDDVSTYAGLQPLPTAFFGGDLYGVDFENVGECCLHGIAQNGVFQLSSKSYGSWGGGLGTALSSDLVTVNYWASINAAPCSVSGFSWNFANLGGSPLDIGSSGYGAIFGTVANNTSDFDFGATLNQFKIINLKASYNAVRDLREPRYERDFLRRSEKRMITHHSSQGNLCKNPENAANWQGNPGTVSTARMSTLTGTGGPLAGLVMSRLMVEEVGPDPVVVVITPPSGFPASAFLQTHHLQTLLPNQSFNVNFWAAQSIDGNLNGKVDGWLHPDHSGLDYGLTIYGSAFHDRWTPITQLGYQSRDFIDISPDGWQGGPAQINVQSGVAGSIVYIVGAMLSANDTYPYNPNPGATDLLPSAAFSSTNANLTNSNYLSPGTIAFATDGRNIGEAAAAGTGCLAFVKLVNGSPTWCAVWSGVEVTT